MCEHLLPLQTALQQQRVAITSSGQAWSKVTGTWTYYDCKLDLSAIRKHFKFPDFIEDHLHLGTHDGSEAGFVCTRCDDAVMGLHPTWSNPGTPFKLNS